MKKKLGVKMIRHIDELVDHYVRNRTLFTRALINLKGYIDDSPTLQGLIHSIKTRTKDPEHLRDKLTRKAIKAANENIPFDITCDSLFSKINDLAGFRIIHLHTKQIEKIKEELHKIFLEEKWQIIEGPTARTWDEESSRYFQTIGIEIHPSPNLNMYTSVHYVIKPNSSSSITCEIQVRTLMEEVWGEVDHTINYPHKTGSIPCQEQIKVLARATSSCSRLVDSIFRSHEDYEKNLLTQSPMTSPKNLPLKKKSITKPKKKVQRRK